MIEEKRLLETKNIKTYSSDKIKLGTFYSEGLGSYSYDKALSYLDEYQLNLYKEFAQI